jgi:hypothetical protein
MKRHLLLGLPLVALAACQEQVVAQVDGQTINFGDDSSVWANDAECDDPRFAGIGMADELITEDLYSDATDCMKLLSAGLITYRG